MGFDIPEPFVWDESFKVFYENLDTEHKGLFKGIFDLCASNDAAHLATLAGLIKEHFKNEEDMMNKNKYENYQAHKKVHDDFQKDLKGLSAPVPADKLNWAKDWLVNHIKGTDFKYKGKLG